LFTEDAANSRLSFLPAPSIIGGMKLWGLLAFFAVAAAYYANAENIIVNVDTQNTGEAISSDFIGLSYESATLLPDSNGKYFFNPGNKALIQMFRALGVKSLRIGGNTADRKSVPVPGKPDIDSLFAFAKAADVKVLYTLRLNEGETKPVVPGPTKAGSKEAFKPYDPKADAETAKYIQTHYADNLECFIIGNEPDHYCADFPSYRADWERFADAVSAAVPDARFCGPSTTPGHVAWAGDFARELGREKRIAFITQHNYAAGSGRTTNITAAREKLLSPKIEQAYEKVYGAFVPAVLEAGQHFRLEECNSLSNGGAPGVSDAFSSALWGIDYMYWWASHHASGLNFHTGPRSMKYAVFVTAGDGYAAHPLAYAMKAFEMGSHGHLVPIEVNSAPQNFRAYAVLADNSLFVTLINKEHASSAQPADVLLNPGRPAGSVQIIRLIAPNNNTDAKTGISLGGSAINDDGTWQGTWTPLDTREPNGGFKIPLPPASIAVVKLSLK
jgi:hypothetical protein